MRLKYCKQRWATRGRVGHANRRLSLEGAPSEGLRKVRSCSLPQIILPLLDLDLGPLCLQDKDKDKGKLQDALCQGLQLMEV